MFSIFYAGSMSKPECTPDRKERTDHGWKICDLHLGLEWFEENHGKITRDSIVETHSWIGDTLLSDKEEIFEAFQGEFMDQETADVIRERGATHTSMMVGDILIDSCSGDIWFCDSFGFEKVEG